jgi:DNA-binding transcriptional MerR regulator
LSDDTLPMFPDPDRSGKKAAAEGQKPSVPRKEVVPPARAKRSGLLRGGEGGGERAVAQREYYSIGEVCDLVGLKSHVLRYWESQFPELNPSKNRSGNRVYQRKEIRLILLVKELLYQDKYTIEGARQKLETLRKGGELHGEAARRLGEGMAREVRAELEEVLRILTPPSGP